MEIPANVMAVVRTFTRMNEREIKAFAALVLSKDPLAFIRLVNTLQNVADVAVEKGMFERQSLQ